MNRAQAMETKEFRQRMGDKVREEDPSKQILTDEAISIFFSYTHSRKTGNRKSPDFEEGGRWLHECLAPYADKIIDEIIEAHTGKTPAYVTREVFPEWYEALSEAQRNLRRLEP